MICHESQEVSEMYTIIGHGCIGIGYSKLIQIRNEGQNENTSRYNIVKRMKAPQVICDHYVMNNKKANFAYMALYDTNAFALTKEYLTKIFKSFPDYQNTLRAQVFYNYSINVFKQLT